MKRNVGMWLLAGLSASCCGLAGNCEESNVHRIARDYMPFGEIMWSLRDGKTLRLVATNNMARVVDETGKTVLAPPKPLVVWEGIASPNGGCAAFLMMTFQRGFYDYAGIRIVCWREGKWVLPAFEWV